MDKIKGLYFIKDLRTDKVIYIGQTSDFHKRKIQHFNGNIQPIDVHMLNNGRENFLMEIFQDIDATNFTNEELRKKEDELIVFYNTIHDGLNKLRSGLVSKNAEYLTEYRKEYCKTEKMKEYRKQYCKSKKYKEGDKERRKTEEFKDYRRQYCKEWRDKNKKHISDYNKKYYEQNKEAQMQRQREYRKRKKAAQEINTKTDD